MTSPRPTRNPPGGTRGTAVPPRPTAKARTAYPADVKARALEDLARTRDLAGVHARHDVSKSTLSRWAKAAGVDLAGPARERTATAHAATTAKVAEVRVTTTDRLERVLEAELATHGTRVHLEQALTRELDSALAGDLEARGEVFRLMRGDTGPTIMLRDPDSHLAQLVAALELLNVTVPKRDTVGAWTRAVHDLNLLRGEATERGDVVVRFGIPRPDTTVVATPEAELGR